MGDNTASHVKLSRIWSSLGTDIGMNDNYYFYVKRDCDKHLRLGGVLISGLMNHFSKFVLCEKILLHSTLRGLGKL